MRNLGNLGNLERTLGTLSEPWEPWEPLLGNLGTFTWEPGNLYLGTFTWEPGNLYLEPGNLGGMGFGAAPVCSETFTMAEDPKAFCCWGMMLHRLPSKSTDPADLHRENQWNAVGQMSQICGTSCNPVLELSHHWGKPITIILRGVAKTSAARNIPIFRGNPGFLLAKSPFFTGSPHRCQIYQLCLYTRGSKPTSPTLWQFTCGKFTIFEWKFIVDLYGGYPLVN